MEAALAILSLEVGGTSRGSGLPRLPGRERRRWRAFACGPVPAVAVRSASWGWSSSPGPNPPGEWEQTAPVLPLPQAAEPALPWLPFLKAEPRSGFLLGARGCSNVPGSVSSGLLPFPKGKGLGPGGGRGAAFCIALSQPERG